MPKLVLIAENKCGHASPFVLRGQEKKAKDHDDDELDGEVVVLDLTDEWHTVVEISVEKCQPGEQFCRELELDYDLRPLSWVVPTELIGRFELKHFQWGEYPLISQPGMV